jgi:hypothetical protein
MEGIIMSVYEYDRPVEPVLYKKVVNSDPPPTEIESGIQPDVLASAMINKSIVGCSWDSEDGKLHIEFTGTLSGGDKAILDGIVDNN